MCNSALLCVTDVLPICHVDLKVLLFPCGSSAVSTVKVELSGGYTLYEVQSMVTTHRRYFCLSRPYYYVHRRSDTSISNMRLLLMNLLHI